MFKKWHYTPDPKTLVDRLNGIYPSAVGPYVPPPINKEAAAEIVRLMAQPDDLRKAAEKLEGILSMICEIKFPGHESRDRYHAALNDLRTALEENAPPTR